MKIGNILFSNLDFGVENLMTFVNSVFWLLNDFNSSRTSDSL